MSVEQARCRDFTPLYEHRNQPLPDERLFHFEHCSGKSPYEGFWRWYFAGLRCTCPCHRLHLDPQTARQIERMVLVKAVLFTFSPIPIFVLLILFF